MKELYTQVIFYFDYFSLFLCLASVIHFNWFWFGFISYSLYKHCCKRFTLHFRRVFNLQSFQNSWLDTLDVHAETLHTHKCMHTIHTLYTDSTHTRTHAHTRTHMYTHVHTCAHAHMYTCTHMHTRTHVCTHMYAHTYTHAHTRTHAHTHVCTHACTHARAHTHLSLLLPCSVCLWPLPVAPEASLLIVHLPPVKCFFLSQNCSSKYFMKQLDRSLRVVLACPNASKMLMTCRKRETVTVLIMCLNKMGWL